MHCITPAHSRPAASAPHAKRLSVAIIIALATQASAPTAWAQDESSCGQDEQPSCEPNKGISGWAIGGIAALLGIGAASGGGSGEGGGAGQTAPGGSGGTGGGNIVPPPGEGGRFGSGGGLTAANETVRWQQNLTTQVIGKNVRNAGQLDILAGSLVIEGEGELDNRAILNVAPAASLILRGEGELDNRGSMRLEGLTLLSQGGSLENFANLSVHQSRIELSGDSDLDNEINASLILDGSGLQLREMAEFENHGRVLVQNPQAGSVAIDISTLRLPGEDDRQMVPFDNRGSMALQGDATLLRLQAASYPSIAYNRAGGVLSSVAAGMPMIVADGAQARFVNQGVITVSGDGAVAMSGRNHAVLVNEGTINLGSSGAGGHGMIAMQSDGSAQLQNRGTINIHAADSYAFAVSGGGVVGVSNTGRINLYGAGSGEYAPAKPIQRYTAASLDNGRVGQLYAGEQGATLQNPLVDTGFTAGTAATHVVLEAAFVGKFEGLDGLASTSAVWQARALDGGAGSTDIEMVKRDYTDLVSAELTQVAAALDAGYTNSALFRSLELESGHAVNTAIRQLSGAGLASGTARALSAGQTFWSAIHSRRPTSGLYAAGFGHGLSTGWGPQGNGSAVAWVSPGRDGQLDLQAGLLNNRYGGSGQKAQDQLDSRYFGMGWSGQWRGIELRQALSSESHRLDSTRTLGYGQVSQQARSERDIQRHSLSSFARRSFTLGATSLQPRLGVSAFRQTEAGFREHAAAFGLNVGAGSATGLDLEAGLGMSHALGRQWQVSADAALIRSLSYSATLRQASFQGAPQVSFSLPQDRRSGLDYRLSLGADHWRGASRLHLGANLQRAWGESDHGVSGSWSYLF